MRVTETVLVGLYLGLALSVCGSWLVILGTDHATRSIR